MTPDESLKVCRLAKALSPAQAVDEYMPEAWHLILRNWRCVDAMAALEQLGGEQEWLHVSHIVGRIKRIRRDRVLDYGTIPDPPAGLNPDDTEAYRRWLDATTEAIADGTYRAPDPQAVGAKRDVIRELGHIGQPIDAIEAAKPLRSALQDAQMAKQEAEAARETKRREKAARLAQMRAEDRAARETARETATASTEGA